ncbi:hypothetical protein SVIO_110490 [Streptomyces violaceusniger]|uniref:Transcription regulator HTH AraC- type ligand binding domain-containing protein n=1 Tax=Streptomyces violaceusniger TaxID=68280 RepID=A0A4D4LM88_STRVO|nr:hypothetical protein SVIO_110490 [Streptomyces violaceusniger]
MERSTTIEPLAQAMSGEPDVLRSYTLCRAARFDAFRESLNGVFYPARVEPTCRNDTLDGALLSAVSLKHLTLGFVRFGTETRLDPGALGAYHVNVALSGRSNRTAASKRSSPGRDRRRFSHLASTPSYLAGPRTPGSSASRSTADPWKASWRR